ncbi:FHA domain-containing protein [Streptomyces sp. NPDC093109]|uniref:FHA domain-containing protein n=1 Tax=Streptomyces sp. NPDC093109 TaxID=3154977 RepID=UPI00344BD230
MPTCPNGHQSGSEDWCEVCGHRMAGQGAPAGAVPPPPPPPPASGYGYPATPGFGPAPGAGSGPGAGPGGGPGATMQAQLCPQCRTPRESMAPFCEECRWNFLTNTATSYTPLAPQHPMPGGPGGPGGPGAGGPPAPPPGLNLPPGFQAQQPPRPPDPFEYQSSSPSRLNRPAEPLASEPPPERQGPPPYQQQSGPPPPSFPQQSAAPLAPPRRTGDDDWMLPPPGPGQAPPPYQSQQGSPQGAQQSEPMRQYQPPPPMPSAPSAPATWTAVIGPDRDYFMAMMQRSGPEATGLNLPAYSPEQRLQLSGNQVAIGRRRHSTGESPEIDLSVPPEDPGVSHQHAVLVRQPDGSWSVVDQNSTNGTTLNGAEDPIQPYVPIPLKDGDRVHVGAWTTITIRRD